MKLLFSGFVIAVILMVSVSSSVGSGEGGSLSGREISSASKWTFCTSRNQYLILDKLISSRESITNVPLIMVTCCMLFQKAGNRPGSANGTSSYSVNSCALPCSCLKKDTASCRSVTSAASAANCRNSTLQSRPLQQRQARGTLK